MNGCWANKFVLKPIFSDIWQTDDLLTSFDGIGIRDFGENDDGLDWHVDQAYSGRTNVKEFLNPEDCAIKFFFYLTEKAGYP